MTEFEKKQIDDATALRHVLWVLVRRFNWIIALIAAEILVRIILKK